MCELLHSLASVIAADAKEKQYWINQLRSCAKHHKEGNSKVNNEEGEVMAVLCGVGEEQNYVDDRLAAVICICVQVFLNESSKL